MYNVLSSHLLLVLVKIVCLLVTIAYYTIAERKIMASIQRRRGPNVVGFWGLLQPLADGLKLVAKEMVIPSHSNSRIFVIAPLCVLTLSLISWSILPFGCFDYSEYLSSSSVVDTVYAQSPRITVLGTNDSPIHEMFAVVNPNEAPMASPTPNPGSGSNVVGLVILSIAVVAGLIYAVVTERGAKGPSVPDKKSVAEPAEAQKVVSDAPTPPPYDSTSSEYSIVELADVSDISYGILAILALSSLIVYGLILSGWASNSKYAFLGALRSAAQMISYEVSISLVLVPIIFMAGSLNLTQIVFSQIHTVLYVFPLAGLAIIFFISMIAETNRTPFDLPEAEAELVAGYNVEFSSIIFAMFFLAEYGNMTMMSVLKADLFLGGWYGPAFLPSSTNLALKALIFCFAFVLVRATFPRYRYDQLMDLGWKVFLLVATGLLLVAIGVVRSFNATI